jgi:hypothetical protein
MIMKTKRKILTIAGIALLAGGIVAGFVLAQDSDEGAAPVSTASGTFLARVASILGVEESALVGAFEQARLEEIDAAVADGRLTQEQADAMKANIEARSALRGVVEDAIASGRLTQEQADLLQLRFSNGGLMGRGGLGSRGGMQMENLDQRGQGPGGFGFMLRTPRGMMGGGIWGRCP